MGIFTRRQLLFSALVGGVLTACSKSKIPEKILSQGGLDIVDSHVHVWTPDTKTYPLAPGFTVKDFWFPSFSKDDLLDMYQNQAKHFYDCIYNNHKSLIDIKDAILTQKVIDAAFKSNETEKFIKLD